MILIKGTHLYKLGRQKPDEKLSRNFSTSEFRCGCGKCDPSLIIDWRLVKALQKLRNHIERPLRISSGYRCPVHNHVEGGVSGSGHCKGYSADVITPDKGGWTTKLFGFEIWAYREELGIKRVGIYDGYQGKKNFVHIGIKKHPNPIIPDRWGDW